MDESAFRVVVAVGVGLIALALIGQAIALSMMYRVSRAVQQRVSALIDKIEPLVGKIEPLVGPSGPLMQKVVPAIDKAGGALERAGRTADGATQLLSSVNRIVEDNRSKVSEVCGQAVAIAETSRQQVDRIGGLVYEASGIARTRLEQIDRAVENTVDQVEHAGESIRKVVIRPVREVNGVAAGIGAAVATLVHGSRRSSVDAATQDEEMFI